MNAEEILDATPSAFSMDYLTEVEILRAEEKQDSYNPDRVIKTGKLSTVQKIKGYIATAGSGEAFDQPRIQLASAAQLIVPDPNVDIRPGDYIKSNERMWRVTGIPASNTNPFTGWRPTLVADLQEHKG